MTSLIKFNQMATQAEICVKYIKYIFGSLILKEDHLKQDIKFSRVYVITSISIILGLLRVYWRTGKMLHLLIFLLAERIVSLLSKVAIPWYCLDGLCWDPYLPVDDKRVPSEQLIAEVCSCPCSASSPLNFVSVMARASLSNPMFISHSSN